MFFWSFFVEALLSTVVVCVKGEMEKGAVYELDSHSKENTPCVNNLIADRN